MRKSHFLPKLILMLTLDVTLTFGYSYIPGDWILARDGGNAVILVAMAATILITVRRLLEDY
jgi:hypothetical protein